MLSIHETAVISPHADIEPSKRGTKIIIGGNSFIDSFVKIKPAGGVGDIIIGQGCYVNSGCVIYSGNGVKIGDFVSIAANCTFAPVNHQYSQKDILIRQQGFRPSKGGIIIEDDVWIGANCVILDGSHLRKGCVIGAMSVVRGEVPSYTINAGNPLKIIGRRE